MMRFVVAGLMVAGVTAAQAQRVSKVDGNHLLTYCTAKSTTPCDAYLDGVGDGIEGEGRARADACIPKSVTTPQMRDVVVKYLRGNPQTRQMPAGVLVTRAFSAAFPCPK
jgi:hypothetical protein